MKHIPLDDENIRASVPRDPRPPRPQRLAHRSRRRRPNIPASGIPGVFSRAPAMEPDARVLQHLQRIGKSRPARKATLIRLITTQLLKGSSEEEAQLVIGRLEKRGALSISEKGAVTYLLEEAT